MTISNSAGITGVTGDSPGAPPNLRRCGAVRTPTGDSDVGVVDANTVASPRYAWAGKGRREVYIAGGEPDECFDVDDAERLAAATLAAVRLARSDPDQPPSREPQSLIIRGHRIVLPAPDPSDSDDDLCGYGFFGRGAAAAFPGDDRVHVMAVGGEAGDADDAEAWAVSVLAAVWAARGKGAWQ